MTVDSLNELDLSYTPPLGSPWDATQMAAQAWVREHHLDGKRRVLTEDSGGQCVVAPVSGAKPLAHHPL